MKLPRISVIIPLYNHEKYIEEAVFSVLEQTVSDFELIIINDGSEDNSTDVVQKIKDNRIRYYYQENRGAHNTLNRGIDMAQGEFISILNSDDVYDRNRFELCLNTLEKDSSTAAVSSYIEYIDENGRFIKLKRGAEDNWIDKESETSFKDHGNLTLDLLAGNFLKTTSNLFCRRDVFSQVGRFRDLRYTHDYDFFLRLSHQHHIQLLSEPLLKYRIHQQNTLKENTAAADFECALVLSDFIIKHDLSVLFGENLSLTMTKFFNSLHAHHSERMILTLLLFSRRAEEDENMFELLCDNKDNPFRESCIKYLENYMDGWMAREKIAADWNVLHEQFLHQENELALLKKKLNEKSPVSPSVINYIKDKFRHLFAKKNGY